MITQFALRLICGMSLTWCILPREQITSGYFRIQMLVTLGLSVLAAVAAGQLSESQQDVVLVPDTVCWIAVGLGVLSFVGSVMWTLERRRGATNYAFAIAVISFVTLLFSAVSTEGIVTLGGVLYCLSEAATAWVSGAAVSGMLLGHWYLTAPTMSTSPLNRANVWLGSAAGLRLALGALALCLYWSVVGSGMTDASPRWTSTHSTWLALLWIGGIIGPIIVAIAVARILRYRNTQSATGVLFVGVILAFIGEMTGALLRNEMQLPL